MTTSSGKGFLMENGYVYGKINNLKLDTRWPNRCEYLFFDLPSHRADKLFIRSKVPVHFFRKEMEHPDFEYVIVFCRFKKQYEERFLECMADLERAMILEGHGDYRACCEWWSEVFGSWDGDQAAR